MADYDWYLENREDVLNSRSSSPRKSGGQTRGLQEDSSIRVLSVRKLTGRQEVSCVEILSGCEE